MEAICQGTYRVRMRLHNGWKVDSIKKNYCHMRKLHLNNVDVYYYFTITQYFSLPQLPIRIHLNKCLKKAPRTRTKWSHLSYVKTKGSVIQKPLFTQLSPILLVTYWFYVRRRHLKENVCCLTPNGLRQSISFISG